MEDIPQFIKDISEFDNVLHRGAIENEQKFYDILSTLDIQRVFDYFENLFFKRVWDFFKVSILFSKIVTFYRNRGYIFCTFYFDHRDIEDILIYQKVSPSLANLVSEEVLDVGHTTHRITIVKDKLVNITDHFFFEYIYDNHIKKNEEITLKDIRLYLSNRLLYDSSSSIYTDERMITRDSDDPFVYILFHDIESLHKYFSLHDILNPKYSRSHRVNDVVYHLSLISYSALNNFVEGFKF